jgi:hypothetical protein
MSGVSYVVFNLNTPFSGGGSYDCPGQYSITGFVFQGAWAFDPSLSSSPFPTSTIMIVPSSGNVQYYDASWSNIALGSGSVSETIEYTTYNGVTGWWFEIVSGSSTYYLESIGSDYHQIWFNTNYPPNPPVSFPCSNLSITSVGTTTSGVGPYLSTFNPSIAMEVDEATTGNFFTDNPNFAPEVDVTSGQFYNYGDTRAGGVDYFEIGHDPPPSNSYGSGLTYIVNGATLYYGEFGTSAGIANVLSGNWALYTPRNTQSPNAILPNLNEICSGSTCSGTYYLTMHISGCPSGDVCTVSPRSGYQTAYTQVQISASISGPHCTSGKVQATVRTPD